MVESQTRSPDGKFINSAAFREEALHYLDNGYYCNAPDGSPDWREYWTEQKRRCLEGYEVGGSAITGDHYFYLNFNEIQVAVDDGDGIGHKERRFPDFWDGDFNFFWIREIARKGILRALNVPTEDRNVLRDLKKSDPAAYTKIMFGYWDSLQLLFTPATVRDLEGGLDLVVGKARRRGYSYKNSAIAVVNLAFRRKSYTMMMAWEKKFLFPKGLYSMTADTINFINMNTAWVIPSDYVNKQGYIRNSYLKYVSGVKVESGSLAEIEAISFKDNTDAGRGVDAYDIMCEESGAFGGPGQLKESLEAQKPSTGAGSLKTGLITVFGTSGDIEGGTYDFASIHGKPAANGFMAFKDRWGKLANKMEGFFHPACLNREGFYDENGNSDIAAAKKDILDRRERFEAAGLTSAEMQLKIQEDPLNSVEAFALTSRNNFPVVELQARLDIVNAYNIQEKKGSAATLYKDKGEVKIKYDLRNKLNPITSYRDLPSNLTGAVVVYEEPIPGASGSLYKIGYDPVRQDTGSSLAGIIVYRSASITYGRYPKIVAEYVGRLETPDDIDRLSSYLAELYGTKVMHENEVPGVKNFYRRNKILNLLAYQPDKVISKNIKKSTVARIYGCHMSIQLKDAGERYIKELLVEVVDYDENGDPITFIDTIDSRRLLEELIGYYREGNFDLVSALIMCLFQVQEESLNVDHGEDTKSDKLKSFMLMLDGN